MMGTSPRRWLAIRRKTRGLDASVLRGLLEVFEQAMKTTDRFISLINASDQPRSTNTDHVANIKARRLVLAVIQNDLHTSTMTERRAAVPMEIPSDQYYRPIHAPRTIALQLILNVFVNDCLRGMTGCRSSITTCGKSIL